jgi:heme/copper-type cytochrome/quinol oxidase subunit 4
MLARMLVLATIEAALAVLFFMHLWMENRGLLWFVVILTGFVIFAMQYSWTDSFRLLNGVPWAK